MRLMPRAFCVFAKASIALIRRSARFHSSHKRILHPSQKVGRCWGSLPAHYRRSTFHYCSVPRFLTAFFVNIGNEWQNRLMTEYAGYFDASGAPDDKPFVVVAGFIATEKQWLEFEQPWRERPSGLTTLGKRFT
jgi:hypothetical protein